MKEQRIYECLKDTLEKRKSETPKPTGRIFGETIAKNIENIEEVEENLFGKKLRKPQPHQEIKEVAFIDVGGPKEGVENLFALLKQKGS